MDSLLANHMPFPCIVTTVPEEVGFYGDVQQVSLANNSDLMLLPENKMF